MSADLPEHFQPDLKDGATVQLRSGGQPMTIEEFKDGMAACVWFEKGRVRRDVFPAHTLKRNTDGVDMTLIIQGIEPPETDNA